MKRLLFFLLVPTLALAQAAFNGTWRLNVQNPQFSGRPDSYSLQNGIYRCDTCDPKLEVKADGQDHEVSGSPYFNTVNVRAVDDKTVEVVNKKDGKVTGSTKMVASNDGKTLTIYWTFVAENGQKGSGKYISTRVGEAPTGASPISGSWRPQTIESASDNVLVITFKPTADGLRMSDQVGDSYMAKFDGKDYPYKGDPGITSVSLKKIDANTVEETDKRNGQVVSVAQMTVAPDGRTMTLKVEDKLRGTKVTWQAQKQ